MTFYTIAPGQVRSDLVIPAFYEGYPGVVHGGIIATILDETGSRAFMDDPTRFMVTAQLNVRYRKPVPSVSPLVIFGRAQDQRGRVSYAHSEIRDMKDIVLAEAELVLVDIPESQLEKWDPKALGWKVYPDLDEEAA